MFPGADGQVRANPAPESSVQSATARAVTSDALMARVYVMLGG